MSIYAIIDLQFGSTGKGQLAGELALRRNPDVVACAFTPNAGHTFVDKDGVKHIHRAIPNGVISPCIENVLIGPGAVVDLEQMQKEVGEYYSKRKFNLIIHPNAVILEPHHKKYEEATLARIGSTMKGTAEAMIGKMRRDPNVTTIAGAIASEIEGWGPPWIVDADRYFEAWYDADVIQIEGTQGYSLSMHHGFWPYVTAKDTTVMQLLADVAIPAVYQIWGTLRTYPIRVANRPQGTSGPCYDDQEEIQWSDIGLGPELTTVTQLPRRIFTFSRKQVYKAIVQNRVTHLFVNFLNYLSSKTDQEKFLKDLNYMLPVYCKIAALGYGPNDVRFV